MMRLLKLTFLVCVLNLFHTAQAQQKDQTSLKDTLRNYSSYKRKLVFAGVLQTRYLASLDKNTDLNGKNFDPSATKNVTNSFMVKRARVMGYQ
jgi:hypothetical protein